MADQLEQPKESGRPPARAVAGVILVVIVALFAVLNLDDVKVNWIVTTGHAPLIVVIVLSLATGAGAGYLASRRRARQRD